MREERITRESAKLVMRVVGLIYAGNVKIPEIDWGKVFKWRYTITADEAIKAVQAAIDEANK